MNDIRAFFASLTPTGRAVVGVALVVIVAALLVYALSLGYDLAWLTRWLTGG